MSVRPTRNPVRKQHGPHPKKEGPSTRGRGSTPRGPASARRWEAPPKKTGVRPGARGVPPVQRAMPPKQRAMPPKQRVMPPKQAEPAAGRDTMRINRYLSMCGLASRRKAEALVVQGKVSVNGTVILDLGHQIAPDRDKVVVDGRQVVRTHEFTYLVMNKPKDTITTLSDERGRPTVMALLKSKRRVYPIGRLDRNTTGVLLLTDDGDFANRLMHPRYAVPKSYLVACAEPVRREDLQKLASGIRLDDGVTAPAGVEVIGGKKGMEIGITIHEGRNRQVRRMFEELGYTVKRLERVAYGPVTAAGLPRGETRPMTHQEIRLLKKLAGMPAEE